MVVRVVLASRGLIVRDGDGVLCYSHMDFERDFASLEELVERAHNGISKILPRKVEEDDTDPGTTRTEG
jgi:hypothetical protein